jgi:hypothetical protein
VKKAKPNASRPVASPRGPKPPAVPDARLDALIEEATVDAYGESEQTSGFYTMLEEYLAVPFRTKVLGVEVVVQGIDLTDDDHIVAVCRRGRVRQRMRIVDLPLPDPPPTGWEWIAAYRRWARGR